MKYLFTPYIYILFFLGSFQQLYSQNFTLKISAKDRANNSIIKQLKFREKHQTIKSLFTEVDLLQLKLEKYGYLNNRLDSLINKDSAYTAHFILGRSTKRIKIFYDNTILTKKDLFQFTKDITDNYFETTIEEVSTILNQLVSFFENQGNSFTEMNLKDIEIKEDKIVAKLNVKISEQRMIDRVIVNGYKSFPKTFLKHFLNLESKTLFTTKKVNSISERIKAIPFVSEVKSSKLLFTKDSTYLYLYLKKEKANRFDGLIGFTSNETSSGLDFNGYLDLDLNNILNGGEHINLNWKNNGNNRQFFNLGFKIPYLFNSPITPKFELNIYKQDSSFVNTNLNLELGYLINYRNNVSLIYESKNSDNLLNNAINNVVDFSSTQFGANYNYTVLHNSKLFPTKFNVLAKATLGNRKSQAIKINQSQINLLTNYLWSFNFRNHLFIQSKTALLDSDNYLTNELFRIGGVNSIRGFNEESILASLYSIVNLEYRFNPNNSSYLYTISDFGFIRNQLQQTSEQLFSLGLGYTFNTNFGLLNLSYAIGKFENQSFNFNNSRFHLKILSFF